jgi:hypothetical protein
VIDLMRHIVGSCQMLSIEQSLRQVLGEIVVLTKL